jgi:FAD:protein FMN transferase
LRRSATIISALLLSACTRAAPAPSGNREAGHEASAAPASAAPDAGQPDVAPAEPEVHRAERNLMGTIWALTLLGGSAEKADAAAAAALDEVARLEQLLSEWQSDSEISRVNQAAGVAPVHVGPELIACVRASLEVARWSDGAFDISWASLRGLWDFSASSAHVPPSKASVKERLPLWNYRNIVLDEAHQTLFLKRRGMQIGLGGVAKGYALDRAGELLQRAGFDNFLIYAGGQVLVHGRRGDRPWRVGIQHPREPRHFAYVEIEDGSLATSGDYEHAYRHEGRTYHHIIDPKTGFPASRISAVTLVSKTALWADAVDTALFIMGPQAALRAIERAPGGPFDAAIVDPTMRLSLTDGMRARVIMTAALESDGRIGRALDPDEPRAKLPALHQAGDRRPRQRGAAR